MCFRPAAVYVTKKCTACGAECAFDLEVCPECGAEFSANPTMPLTSSGPFASGTVPRVPDA